MQIGVDGLHVVQRDRFAQQLLVKRQREASVNVVAVEHRHAHDATHKVEVRQVLLNSKQRGSKISVVPEKAAFCFDFDKSDFYSFLLGCQHLYICII